MVCVCRLTVQYTNFFSAPYRQLLENGVDSHLAKKISNIFYKSRFSLKSRVHLSAKFVIKNFCGLSHIIAVK